MIRPRKPQEQIPAVMAPPMDQPLGVMSQGPLDMAGPGLPEMPDPKLPGPKFFSKDGLAPIILGIIGDTLAQRNGGQAQFAPMYRQIQEQKFDREKFDRELELKRVEKMRPRLEQVGNAIGMVDPATGAFTPTYTGPEEQTSLQQNIDYLRKLRPDMSDKDIAAIVQQNITQPQFPRMVTYAQGDQTVTEELNPDGTRKPVASAPRWQPKPSGSGSAKLPPGFILDGN